MPALTAEPDCERPGGRDVFSAHSKTSTPPASRDQAGGAARPGIGGTSRGNRSTGQARRDHLGDGKEQMEDVLRTCGGLGSK